MRTARDGDERLPADVRRPRLARLLNRTRARAIVITAPAGYGKTTLVADWLRDRPNVAWYRVARGADATSFARGVGASIASILGGRGERISASPPAPETATTPVRALAERASASWPAGAFVVIDGYHNVAGSADADRLVDSLLELPAIRLVVTTRRHPPWASARRLVHGEVAEITAEHLALTKEEARTVLGAVEDEQIRGLAKRAEGWPALVALFGRSDSLDVTGSRVSDALSRYFAEEVVASEPTDVRTFMRTAAIAPTVNAPFARQVLGLGDADHMIDLLKDDGLLHETREGELGFNPLLRDFLRRQLEADAPSTARQLVERVIDHARRASRWEDAFTVAIETGLAETASIILADASVALLREGRIETLERWLEMCGRATLHRTPLILAKCEVLIRTGRVVEAAALAHDLASRLPAGDAHASSAWYLAGRAFHLLSDEERALDAQLKARAVATSPERLADALCEATAMAAHVEADAVERLLAEIERVPADDIDTRLQVASGKVFLASRGGTLAGVWKSIEPLLHLADGSNDPMAKTNFLTMCAYVNRSRADYRTALSLTESALAASEQYRLGPIRSAFCLCQRAAAEIGVRSFPSAEATIDIIARSGIEDTKTLVLQHTLLRSKLLLAQGKVEQARAKLELPDSIESMPDDFLSEYYALLAVASAAIGDVDTAVKNAERAEESSRDVETTYYSAFARVIIDAHMRQSEAVSRTAIELVTETAKAEMQDAFVVAYRAYPRLLRLLQVDRFSLRLAQTTVGAARDFSLATDAGFEIPKKTRRRELLTKREAEVFRLICDGLSNAEIARRLVISPSTAKLHTHRILKKLGVQSRVQAVVAMRTSGTEHDWSDDASR